MSERVIKVKLLPFLIKYTPPCKVYIRAILYYDEAINMILPTLTANFPEEGVVIESGEHSDRCELWHWITIDWSVYEEIWDDHLVQLEIRVFQAMDALVQENFNGF